MIKVTIGESKTQEEKPFPKLMIATYGAKNDKGIVVLFVTRISGTVIITTNDSEKIVGGVYTTFLADSFTDYNEPITIQNI